jgi:hypothetical protein
VGHLPAWNPGAGVSLAVRSRKHKEKPAIAGEANHPVIIHASAAYRSDVGVYIDALGTVTPIYTINVFSQVSGQLLAVHYAIARYCVHVRAQMPGAAITFLTRPIERKNHCELV